MASFPLEASGSRRSSFSANGDPATQMRQRTAAVQSLAKMEQSNARPVDTDALFASIKETYWTVADHHRLYAIDRLQTRIMEYHNNVHQRDKFAAAPANNVRPDDVVAFLMTCSASHTNKMFQPVEMGSLPSLLKKTKSFVNGKPKTGLEWYHMMDLSALPVIADELKLDILCREHFRDLRFQSMELPVVGGCCMSFCYFQLDPFTLSVGMFKLYFYVTHGFVLTFVAELMPDMDVAKPVSGPQTPIDRDARTVQEFLQQQEDVPVPIDAVFNAVAERWELLVNRASELGPMYVFYELASEALSAQDSLMEFLSRSIFHFKRKTSFRLSYRKKLQLVKRLHIVNTAISMVESCTSHASLVVAGLMATVTERSMHMRHPDTASESDGLTLDGLVPPSVLGVRQLPVLYDLRNSYSFVNECLRNEAKEVREVSDAIDSISQMRADHTALVLSLIATIFLPATFLTGVFGMNFQEHGGYTIEIVNSKYGPMMFYLLCVVLAISLCIYYITMGWIEAFSPVRAALKLLLGKEGMISVLGEDFEEDVNDDPAEKHPKMVSVEGLVQDGDSDHDDSTAGLSPADLASRLEGEKNKELNSVVRSPLPASNERPPLGRGRESSRARSSGGGSTGGGRTKSSMMVPQRVAEALEEENRRQEEARRRRELAQLQGMQPSTSAGGMCSTQLLQSTLQHRSRSVNRASSTEGSVSASTYRK